MKNFNFLWIFLITWCYFKVNPSQVKKYHPARELSRVKQIAQYLIYCQGASCRVAGEVVGVDGSTAKYSIKTIAGLLDVGDLRTKQDIYNLTLLTK